MMTEAKRRNVARKFLERHFGKKGWDTDEPFRLRRDKASSVNVRGVNVARAFEVINAPYNSPTKRKMIVVSDDFDELETVAKMVFEKERYDNDKPDFSEVREGGFVMYD